MNTDKQPLVNSISEAFSMQPVNLTVGSRYTYDHIKTVTIAKIIEEDVYIQGDPYTYYVGYDQDNNRLFEFKKGTVNVMFQIP